MDTFASELCANFRHQLEANHVIKPDQIFVGVYPRGPNGTELLGNFKNVSAFNFQDDIGAAILDICKVTPFGVLCFLPSYSLLEKVLERMRDTGTFRLLQQFKEIVIEPRAGSSEEFEQLIKHYYSVIADCFANDGVTAPSSASRRTVSGAIFFAVYRGKVSEGLDFADEYARAVINIGIPYPAFKDPKVTLKKEYNDRNRDSLLPGNQWYETQAFRALNQALGRCIRHRNDWGAVIFLEQRFTLPRNVQKLSKWVRPAVRQFQSYAEGLQSLRQFMLEKGSKLPEDLIRPTLQAEDPSKAPKRPHQTSNNWPPKRQQTSAGLSWAIDRESDAAAAIDVDEPAAFKRTSDFFKKGKTLGTRRNRTYE
jgi:Fanconi anemia group J protein